MLDGSLKKLISDLYIQTAKIIFSSRCVSCGENIYEKRFIYLCSSCAKQLKIITKGFCKRCSKRISGFRRYIETNVFGCSFCKDKGFHFDRIISSTRYDGVAKNLILGLKFNRRYYNSSILARLLALKLKYDGVMEKIDIIVPVPLSVRRLKERGYNQSQVIAQEIGKAFDIAVEDKTLVKKKDTLPQAVLSDEERIKNVIGSYDVTKERRVEGKSVLLIDDVVTTGATVSECSKVLKKAGAKYVFVASVAR